MTNPERENSGFPRGTEARHVGVIVLTALVACFAAAIVTRSWIFPQGKHFWAYGFEMGQIAASLAMGDGFAWPEWSVHPRGPTAWMPPVYPLLIAGAFKEFGIYSVTAAVALEVFQTVLAVLCCVVLFLIGRRIFNSATGLLAAFLLAIYPPAIHFAVQKIWSTTLFTLCLLILVLALLRLTERVRVRQGAELGILLGFAILLDPIILAAIPFGLAWFPLKARAERRQVFQTAAAMVLACGLAVLPWVARNYLVSGEFMLVKSNFGHTLFGGNMYYLTGESPDTSDGISPKDRFLTEEESEVLSRFNEAQANRFLGRKALSTIQDHPERFVILTGKRIVRFWTVLGVQSRSEKIGRIVFLGVLLLAIVGIGFSPPRKSGVQLLLLIILSLPLPYYFTITTHYRYRFPLEPLLMIFAAHAIYRLGSRWAPSLVRRVESLGQPA